MDNEEDKREFLNQYGLDYGYPNGPKTVDEIRATEFNRLHQNGTVYLDHAGATLYSELQMEAVLKDLTSNVYGNPRILVFVRYYSQSDSSSVTSDIVREARQQVLDYFNASAKDYTCIFTSGATAALKLVGEAFPWSSGSNFAYTMENHNSVLGIREYALQNGAAAFAVDVEDVGHAGGMSRDNGAQMKISPHPIQRRTEVKFPEGQCAGNAYNLFAFPSECNFSGLRFNLDLVKLIKEDSGIMFGGSAFCKGCWLVLIDAAKGSTTQPPDLLKYPADFVVISFYKLFGYPTGLGALIVRNDAAKLLRKTYFSGGTVTASFADMDFVKRREALEELFEDGTSSFLSIASIRHGFKILNSLTAFAICRHTTSLTLYLKKSLLALRHENGAPVCTLYENHASKVVAFLFQVFCQKTGPIVSFNLKRADGSWFGYREVEKLASLSGIQLRTGCFCNPGACAKFLGLSHLDLLSNLEAGHVCWDDNDIINGKPTGAVRISFGYMSTYEDAKKFVDFVRDSFVSMTTKSENGKLSQKTIPFCGGQGMGLQSACYYLKSITIYPIKSCSGFSVESWPLSSTGSFCSIQIMSNECLQHDREWLLKSLNGEILTQKKVPEMCFINTFIDLSKGIMFVESPRCKAKLQIDLKSGSSPSEREEIKWHAQRYEVQHYENDVNQWFSIAVGRPCILIRCFSSQPSCLNKGRSTNMCRDSEAQLNFANEAQYLLISEESVCDLNNRVSSNAQKESGRTAVQVNAMRFRPNLVVSGGEPYAEDTWRRIKVGNQFFTPLGGCTRCQMINLVHQDGQVQRSNEPLATLASYRRVKGKILFGLLLRCEMEDTCGLHTYPWLQVGQEVFPNPEE
ncbi:hypothetical protein Tsubulata_028426 [Turnera subulata]|uniref:Molybdenum cofactor sulfurase n=1 Tax=Turnera subulata TaxID=218843 RepID=A0A9Q0FRI3_9ROSI|nr:hypothetical protein Tsubulata_028426 [Turnera subulata]